MSAPGAPTQVQKAPTVGSLPIKKPTPVAAILKDAEKPLPEKPLLKDLAAKAHHKAAETGATSSAPSSTPQVDKAHGEAACTTTASAPPSSVYY